VSYIYATEDYLLLLRQQIDLSISRVVVIFSIEKQQRLKGELIMPVSIVVGGQFGSEGKGKVTHYFAQKFHAAAVVRVGGSNSGHTVVDKNGVEYVFRTLPIVAIDHSILSVLPSGSYMNLDLLKAELKSLLVAEKNLKIDEYAVIIDQEMVEAEQQSELREQIGSTQSGTGEAVIRRLSRIGKIRFAKDCDELKPYLADTKELMRNLLNNHEHIVIEGTQGFGLSPINSKYYPYCTSRDTTAAGFLSETGLSPLDVENVIMVIRAYPIRVAGNSGELPNEMTWDNVTHSAGADCNLIEYTSVTNRIRRVGAFDADIVKRAIQVNKPNIVVLNHADYIDYSCHNSDRLSDSVQDFIDDVDEKIGQKVNFVGTGKALLVPTENYKGFVVNDIFNSN
jgi:adenylosuccinate synthase